jgi:O-antigen/teichoic acid export membrane protein
LEEVGYFSLALRLPALVMTAVPVVFADVLLPTLSAQFGKQDMSKLRMIYQKATRFLMLLAFPLGIGGIVLAQPIVRLLYGPEYAPVALPLSLIFVAEALRALASGCSALIYGINKPAFFIANTLILAPVNVGLDIWLIPRYGATGAAIANMLVALMAMSSATWYIWRQLKAGWPIRNALRIGAVTVLMGSVAFIVFHLLGGLPGLALAVVAGATIYFVGLMLSGAVDGNDLQLLRGIQESIPVPLRKSYGRLIGIAERVFGASPWGTQRGPAA